MVNQDKLKATSDYFVIGTDTGIGKTHVTCQLAKMMLQTQPQVNILKPIATGCIQRDNGLVSEDVLKYEEVLPIKSNAKAGWCFAEPVSPHLVASISAREVANWCNEHRAQNEMCIIEGAGGLMVPINASETWLDVLRLLKVPVILVVGIRLGCLNHALLTSSVLQIHEIEIAGWVANLIDPNCLYPERLIQTLKDKFSFPCLMTLPFVPS